MPGVPILATHFILKQHIEDFKSRAVIFRASLVNTKVDKLICTGASNSVLSIVGEALFKEPIWHLILWFVFEISLI